MWGGPLDSRLAGGAMASLASGLMNWRSWKGRGASRGTLQGHLPNPACHRIKLSCGLRIHQPWRTISRSWAILGAAPEHPTQLPAPLAKPPVALCGARTTRAVRNGVNR